MTPFYDSDGITIYHGDSRDVLPHLAQIDTVVTDPVWPDCKPDLAGADDPHGLLYDALSKCKMAKRVAIQLGADTDPRFLAAVPTRWKFFRSAWLRYARPNYKGRLLNGVSPAYLFGTVPRPKPGQFVIPGEYMDTDPAPGRRDHPCSRRLNHVRWLLKWWTDDGDIVCDPFMGAGTTLEAAHLMGFRCIGIEIEESYCAAAVKRLEQRVLPFLNTS